MRILGIIPARGGSKGIPKKNVYPLNGIPLIQYTVNAARKSSLLTDFVISTDSYEIGSFAPKTIYRSDELSSDTTPTLPVIQHAIRAYRGKVDAVMILQPTSPLRTAEDIDNAISLFVAEGKDSLVSVCEGVHPIKSYDENYRPFVRQIEPYDKHRHKCFTRNGAIFIATEKLIQSGKITGIDPVLFVMPKSRSVDIDDYEDLKIADALLKRGDRN